MKDKTPKNGTHKVYYGPNRKSDTPFNGSTEIEENYKNGLLHGKVIKRVGMASQGKNSSGQMQYSGRLNYECNYKNGLKDGPEINWSEGSQYKLSEKYYKEGQLDGEEVYFQRVTSNGVSYNQTTYICNYKNGIKEGKCTSWHNAGQKKAEGYYVNGEKEGEWTYWFPNGVIKDPSVKEWEDSNESEEHFPGSDDDFNEYIDNRDSDQPLGPEFGWYEDDINAPYWPPDK